MGLQPCFKSFQRISGSPQSVIQVEISYIYNYSSKYTPRSRMALRTPTRGSTLMLRWAESSRWRSHEVMMKPVPDASGGAFALPPPPEVEGPPESPDDGALLGFGGAIMSSEVRKRWRRRWHMRRAPGSASGSAAASSVKKN